MSDLKIKDLKEKIMTILWTGTNESGENPCGRKLHKEMTDQILALLALLALEKQQWREEMIKVIGENEETTGQSVHMLNNSEDMKNWNKSIRNVLRQEQRLKLEELLEEEE